MSLHKFHRWRRMPGLLKKNQFFCNHPSCYKKISLLQLHGKVAECPNCESKFIVDTNSISPEDTVLVCANCSGKPVKSEAEQLLECIKKETEVFTEESLLLLRTQIQKEKNDLLLLRQTLEYNREKFNRQKRKLTELVQTQRIEFSRKRAALMTLRANLSEREKRVQHKEHLQSMDLEVMADAIRDLVKDKLENESNGSSD